jgi:NADPH2:quinone reductase
MQAVQAISFGDPSVLTVTDLPDPKPAPGQIAIDVTHAAVGLIDVYFRQGLYKDMAGMPGLPFVPGLEVAGTVRELGEGVTGFTIGEKVVSMSAGSGVGGYASVYIAPISGVISIDGYDIDPALAVSVLPNAAMAHVALTHVVHLLEGDSVLIHGALGGFSAGFPGIARQLGASRVVGSVRASKRDAADLTKLPYDRIVDSSNLADELGDEKFDIIIDPVGGEIRTASRSPLALVKSRSKRSPSVRLASPTSGWRVALFAGAWCSSPTRSRARLGFDLRTGGPVGSTNCPTKLVAPRRTLICGARHS